MADHLPDNNDIARYAGLTKINDKTGRLSGAAFLLNGHKYLSVYCLDMVDGDDTLSRIEYLKKDVPLNTKPNGKLGVINVGIMKKFVESESEDKRKLTVTHEPDYPADSRLNCDYHCGVSGLKEDDMSIAQLIARCVKKSYSTLKKSKYDRL